ncbi:MAG: antitoxin VapB family protein [Nanoarchaeota archaeon]
MGSINISLKEEAYEFLKALKSKEKSFSDIILEFKEEKMRRKGSKDSILQFWGVMRATNDEWLQKERRMKKFREEIERRFK